MSFLKLSISRLFICFYLILCIILCSIYTVVLYADISDELTAENVDISVVFESEQVLKKDFTISESLPEVCHFKSSDLRYKIDIVEQALTEIPIGLESYVYVEEYQVGNFLAKRDVTNSIGSSEETKYQKHYRLFGDDAVSMYGRFLYYPSDKEALKHMVTVPISVWSIDDNGEWYIRDCYVTVHKSLKNTVLCIFNDLLNLEEEDRIPIKNVGCYNYREGSSCHSCGAAFDINTGENAEMTLSGVVTAGYYWKPYEDIYSIPPDSKLVEIFAKYGYSWGGFWTSKKDYMHFSYLDR